MLVEILVVLDLMAVAAVVLVPLDRMVIVMVVVMVVLAFKSKLLDHLLH
tara:strand:- start:249 stop:395 length:147 start_codon:yes stop_codon:yes gene_type:complete